jgi:hypothetical protein
MMHSYGGTPEVYDGSKERRITIREFEARVMS